MKTYAPSFTNCFAVARPMPLLPPVTSAIFPSSLPTYFSSAVICSQLRLHQILIASTTQELSHPNIYRTWSAKLHVRNVAVKRHSDGKDVADTFCRSRVRCRIVWMYCCDDTHAMLASGSAARPETAEASWPTVFWRDGDWRCEPGPCLSGK